MNIFDTHDVWRANFESGWLADFKVNGKPNWKLYTRPTNTSASSGPAIDVRKSRIVLISSAGGYLPATQTAFDTENDMGDYSIRRIPVSVPLRTIAYAHTHYDHAAVDADPQVLVPLNHMDALVAAGEIGGLADDMISFMGYQPDVSRLLVETVPKIVEAARALGAQGALLVPS